MDNQLKNWGIFLLLSAIWGSSFLFIKIALNDLQPITLVTIRLGLGAIGLCLIAVLTKRKLPEPRIVILSLLMGITNSAIPFALITWGETTIDSSVASVLNSSVPLFTLIVAHFFLADERITWFRSGGLAMGFLGILLIFSKEIGGALFLGMVSDWLVLRGQLAVVGAAIFYAGSIVAIRRLFMGIDTMILATLQIVGAFLAILPAAILMEGPLSLAMSTRSLFALLWLGLLGTCMAYLIFYQLITAWGATRSTLVTYVVPVFGVTLGAIVLSEPLDWRLFAGLVLIVGGIILVNQKPRQTKASSV